jgi:hypothetical protein
MVAVAMWLGSLQLDYMLYELLKNTMRAGVLCVVVVWNGCCCHVAWQFVVELHALRATQKLHARR